MVHDDRHEAVIAALLREVLSLRYQGDRAAAEKFFDRWGRWTPDLHERLAARMREAQGARLRLDRYAALGESRRPCALQNSAARQTYL